MKIKAFQNYITRKANGKYVFLMLWFAFIILSLCKNIHYDIGGLNYQDWGISDWLINYQGGFVRRGLPGQILYILYSIHPFNIPNLILTIAVTSSILLLIVVLNIFIKKGWSVSILPLGCCFFFIFLTTWQRKDSVLLLLTYCIFVCYRKYLLKKSFCSYLCFVILSTLMILSHEASFFFCFPILIVYGYCYIKTRSKVSNSQKKYQYTKLILSFVPVLLAMMSVCLFKGNEHTPEVIWHSWDKAFMAYPDKIHNYHEIANKIGAGVSALSWKLLPTMKYHMTLNLFGTSPIKNPLSIVIGFPGLIWMLCSYYYLVTRLNTVKIGSYNMVNNTEYEISNTFIMQFIFMTPMFTFLSCDWGRTIPYWVFSTLMAVECFGKLRINILDGLTNKIQGALKYPVFGNQFFYTLIVIMTPLTMFYAPTNGNAMQLRALRKIIHLFVSHIS